jgi:hypothetical protein
MCTKIGIDSADKNGSNVAIKKAFVVLIIIVLLAPTAIFGFNNIQKRSDKGELMIETSVWLRENTDECDVILSDRQNILVREYYAQRKIHSLRLPHDELKGLMPEGKDVYLVTHEDWMEQAQIGHQSKKCVIDISNTVQWLNETYGLNHLKTFDMDSPNLPWSSKIIY